MKAAIALLLTGSSFELSAAIHAVELARRTTGVLHTACKAEDNAHPKSQASIKEQERLLFQVTRLADLGGVKSQLHILERLTGEPLLRFLSAQRIFCLVAAAKNRKEYVRKTAWINLLCTHLKTSKNWYLPDLWCAIIMPWEDETMRQVIAAISSRSSSSLKGEMIPDGWGIEDIF